MIAWTALHFPKMAGTPTDDIQQHLRVHARQQIGRGDF
jgi:hypothetical protein